MGHRVPRRREEENAPCSGNEQGSGEGGGHLLGSITPCPSQVEQRLEPAKRAAHNVHKRLQACLQGQSGSDMDKRVVSGSPREGGPN